MKHFFYTIYVLFYTGAVFLGGMFIVQFLERSRTARRRKKAASSGASMPLKSGASFGDRKVAVMRKRE